MMWLWRGVALVLCAVLIVGHVLTWLVAVADTAIGAVMAFVERAVEIILTRCE
jgi:hypothetical protein